MEIMKEKRLKSIEPESYGGFLVAVERYKKYQLLLDYIIPCGNYSYFIGRDIIKDDFTEGEILDQLAEAAGQYLEYGDLLDTDDLLGVPIGITLERMSHNSKVVMKIVEFFDIGGENATVERDENGSYIIITEEDSEMSESVLEDSSVETVSDESGDSEEVDELSSSEESHESDDLDYIGRIQPVAPKYLSPRSGTPVPRKANANKKHQSNPRPEEQIPPDYDGPVGVRRRANTPFRKRMKVHEADIKGIEEGNADE